MINTLKTQLLSKASTYQTPCYVYSTKAIRENYARIKALLGTSLMLSIKANHCTDLLHLIYQDMDGFEVASEFELNMLAMLKSNNGFINNPSMSPELMRKAVAAKVTITLDHPQQIQSIIPLGKRLKPVCLRLSSALFLNEGEALPKRIDHFGMDKNALINSIVKLKAADIPVEGVHIFRGSHSFAEHAMDTVQKLPGVIEFIENALGYPLKKINLGGGFSPDIDPDTFNFSAYRDALKPLAHYELMHESGRGIFASSGSFITTVVATKTINEQSVIVCDGGMAQNFFLAQTEKTIKQYARPEVCYHQPNSQPVLSQPAKIVGSSCNKEDVIGLLPIGTELPQVGDQLIFSGCGAYNRTYSPIQFLGLTLAREYILDH